MSDVQMTHSTDCWTWHHECAKRAVEELAIDKERFRAENERLRVENGRLRHALCCVKYLSEIVPRPDAEYVATRHNAAVAALKAAAMKASGSPESS